MNPRKTAQGLVVVAAAVLLGWLLFSDGAGARRVAAASRKPAPEIQFATLSGGNWRLADHRGEVVLVNFWATWCPPCRMETPGLVDLSNRYQNRGVVFAGVAMDEGGMAPVHKFVESYRIPYPILVPPENSPLTASIDSLPTTLLIDRQGRVANVYTGMASESDFRRDIDRLLAE